MFSRKQMIQALKNTSEKDIFPTFIPSYKRPDFEFNKSILKGFSPEAQDKFFIVVRKEQYKEYKAQNPNLNYVVIPKGAVTGVGSTRNFIIDYCIKNKIKYAIDMDDDIKYLHYLFAGVSGAGNDCSRHSTIKEEEKHPEIRQRVFQLMCKLAKEIFEDNPDCILGNVRKQHFSQDIDNSQTKYKINSAVTPRQIQILNIKAMAKNKIRVPEEFDLHGDDIGLVAEILQKGKSCFNIPCLCYDYIDEKKNSVVRDPKKENRHLHRLEYNALKDMEATHYLKQSFSFPDGEYMFGDINWRAYHKLHGTEPIKTLWED